MRRCQVCNKNAASVHVFELFETDAEGSPDPGAHDSGASAVGDYQVHEKHICEGCAQRMNLPHMPVAKKKSMVDIWKLLQQSAQRSRQEGGLTCKHCGMTLAEFRSKGRLGCGHCYESFQRHLDPLLERIHNSVRHTGRVPGVDDASRQKTAAIRDLRHRLEEAIREEAYEDAASLRDKLQALEADE